MRRELSWKWRLPIALAAMATAVLISKSMVRGTELAIPKKPRGIVINLSMHREKHAPSPKYDPDFKLRRVEVPLPMDRPAGIP